MTRPWQMLLVVSLVASLATPGPAKPGKSNGESKGKAKQAQKASSKAHKQDKVTTESLGEIVIVDDRIQDLTGDYVLTSGSIGVDLDIVQDSRGRLTAVADLDIPDLVTTSVYLRGRLQLKGRDGDLFFRLNGCVEETSPTNGGPILLSHTEDKDGCTTSVTITGEWEGSAFGTEVCITTPTGTICYDLTDLEPLNTLHEVVIGEPTDEVEKGNGNVIFSERVIMLPWGTENGRSIQINARKHFMLLVHGETVHVQIRGSGDSSGDLEVDRVKLNLGYGIINVDPEDVELPAVQYGLAKSIPPQLSQNLGVCLPDRRHFLCRALTILKEEGGKKKKRKRKA